MKTKNFWITFLVLLVFLLALGYVKYSRAQTVIVPPEELRAYLAKVVVQMNANTVKLKAYETRIAELERLTGVQGEALTKFANYSLAVGTQYSNLLRVFILEACSWNLNATGIAAVLPFYKPFNLGNHTCPTTAPPWQWRVPQYPSPEDAAAVLVTTP